jgi:hypothetical protein
MFSKNEEIKEIRERKKHKAPRPLGLMIQTKKNAGLDTIRYLPAHGHADELKRNEIDKEDITQCHVSDE